MLKKCKELLNIEKYDISNDGYRMKWIIEHLIENRSLLCWLNNHKNDNDHEKREE